VIPGFSMRVIPGYQRLNLRQREALLGLAEDGEVSSPVNVRQLEDRVIVKDRRGRTFAIHPNGHTERSK
jgi:hypothetical protein